MTEKLISAIDVIKYTVLAGEIRNQYMEVVPVYFVREAPAVDAVEVVRCCRCRFAVNKREHGEMVTYCGLDWGMRGVLDPNDYCSYGKEIKRCQD